MHTPAVASDVTSNKNLSPEPSSGSDEVDDEEEDSDWEDSADRPGGRGRSYIDLWGDLDSARRAAARLSAEIAAVGSRSVRAGNNVSLAVKRDLGKDFLPHGRTLTQHRDSFRANAVKYEARLRPHDPEGKSIGRLRTEAEWRQCVVLVGVSEVKYLLWDSTTRAPYGATSAVQLAADAADAAAAAAKAAAAAEYAAAAAAARLARLALPPTARVCGGRGRPEWWGRGRITAVTVKAPTSFMTKEGARCVPHYNPDSESSDGGADSESGEEEDPDGWSGDPSQWG